MAKCNQLTHLPFKGTYELTIEISRLTSVNCFIVKPIFESVASDNCLINENTTTANFSSNADTQAQTD